MAQTSPPPQILPSTVPGSQAPSSVIPPLLTIPYTKVSCVFICVSLALKLCSTCRRSTTDACLNWTEFIFLGIRKCTNKERKWSWCASGSHLGKSRCVREHIWKEKVSSQLSSQTQLLLHLAPSIKSKESTLRAKIMSNGSKALNILSMDITLKTLLHCFCSLKLQHKSQ